MLGIHLGLGYSLFKLYKNYLFCNTDEACVANADAEMKICITHGVRGRKYRCMFKGSENLKACPLTLESVSA